MAHVLHLSRGEKIYLSRYENWEVWFCRDQMELIWPIDGDCDLHVAKRAPTRGRLPGDALVRVTLHGLASPSTTNSRDAVRQTVAILSWESGSVYVVPVSPMVYWAWKQAGRPELIWITNGEGRPVPPNPAPSGIAVVHL